ncbi:hypothetical protein GCM10009813_06360 [Brevibacterium marinum]
MAEHDLQRLPDRQSCESQKRSPEHEEPLRQVGDLGHDTRLSRFPTVTGRDSNRDDAYQHMKHAIHCEAGPRYDFERRRVRGRVRGGGRFGLTHLRYASAELATTVKRDPSRGQEPVEKLE